MPWASTHQHLQPKHHQVGNGNLMDKVVYVLSCVSSLMVKRGKSVTQRKFSCSGSRFKCPDFDRTDATWVLMSPRTFIWRTECKVEQHDSKTVWQLNLQTITTATSNNFTQALVVPRVFVSSHSPVLLSLTAAHTLPTHTSPRPSRPAPPSPAWEGHETAHVSPSTAPRPRNNSHVR